MDVSAPSLAVSTTEDVEFDPPKPRNWVASLSAVAWSVGQDRAQLLLRRSKNWAGTGYRSPLQRLSAHRTQCRSIARTLLRAISRWRSWSLQSSAAMSVRWLLAATRLAGISAVASPAARPRAVTAGRVM